MKLTATNAKLRVNFVNQVHSTVTHNIQKLCWNFSSKWNMLGWTREKIIVVTTRDTVFFLDLFWNFKFLIHFLLSPHSPHSLPPPVLHDELSFLRPSWDSYISALDHAERYSLPPPTSAQTFGSVKCYEASNQENLKRKNLLPFIDTKLISTVKMRNEILAQFINVLMFVLDRRSFGRNCESYFTVGRCGRWSLH